MEECISMNKTRSIAFHTLGCKLNFSETDSISRQFTGEGFREVDFGEQADIYVINSCSVTGKAEKRCRALIRQAHKHNPNAQIVVVGCYSQLAGKELLSLPGVKLVAGNTEKFSLFDHIRKLATESGKALLSDDTGQLPSGFVPTWSQDGRTRSFFKIQDGCDYKCAYCTIPLARGKSRSDSIAGTLRTAREIAGTDMKEVVLTGVNIGDFGKPHGESFFELLKEMTGIQGLERIRLSSVEPDLLNEEIIRLVADHPVLMPHFHIPLQSGSDEMLRAMGRRYTTALFADRVDTIRRHIPHACIAADVIVGYPGETREHFSETTDFIKNTDVSYLHVFTYSERANTRASGSSAQVEMAERKRRSAALQELSENKKRQFIRKNHGRCEYVLWEKEEQNGYMYGFTGNYLKVKTPFRPALVNQIQKVKLNNTDENGVYLV